jgi:hypothetical protein
VFLKLIVNLKSCRGILQQQSVNITTDQHGTGSTISADRVPAGNSSSAMTEYPTQNHKPCSHATTAASALTAPWICLQEYTFTLTQGDGARVQGFCRRFLPPAPRVGSKLRYPQVLCLVCEASWSTLFFKVGLLWVRGYCFTWPAAAAGKQHTAELAACMLRQYNGSCEISNMLMNE